MVSDVISGMARGIEGVIVRVQADISSGLPMFNMIGYLSSEVKEARDRVRSALRNIGIYLPPKRIAVNLAPADVRKTGSSFDLAIAISLLAALGKVRMDRVRSSLFLGELALDGTINPVSGVLPIVKTAIDKGYKRCIVPSDNSREASLLAGIEICGFCHLKDLLAYLNDPQEEVCRPEGLPLPSSTEDYPDFCQVRGQEDAKRALEIAAAGHHHILLDGPPGVGKSMLASCLPGILPELTRTERIESLMIYSVKGLLKEGRMTGMQRPFRSPSHAISRAGIFGGGRIPLPGEISLAHRGVLFLDELCEFDRSLLEMFRTPLESHEIILARKEATIKYPADFVLVAASNPCPCGHYPSPACRCSRNQILKYRQKLSGPILDRIDLFVHCSEVPFDILTADEMVRESESIRKRVEAARRIQEERFRDSPVMTNSHMTQDQIKTFCSLSPDCRKLMKTAYRTFHLSGRSYFRILRTSRTIADLEGDEKVSARHIEEALHFRKVETDI